MRHTLALTASLLLAATAQAQVGPTAARIISKPMPAKAASGQAADAEAELLVNKKGKVSEATIVAGTGDEAFDKQWRKSLSDWRFVPAVDENGTPHESTLRVQYKNNGLAGLPPANAVADGERMERMTCKDFVWEYELVIDALPRRLAMLDPLLRTPLATVLAEGDVSEAQTQSVRERYEQIAANIAGHCRDNPEDAFFTKVFRPTLRAELAK